MEAYKELIILIAEDNDGHAELIKEGLRDANVCNKTIRFENGKEAWEFLLKPGDGVTGRNPEKRYMLLLDINMPVMDGIEVLARMKSEEELKKIPVIMLTTTDDPREIARCYQLGCNVYVTKPIDFNEFMEKLRRIGLFMQIVSL